MKTRGEVLTDIQELIDRHGWNDKTYRVDHEQMQRLRDEGVHSAPSCLYRHTNEPGCIVGWYLHEEFGTSLDDLEMLDMRVGGTSATQLSQMYPELFDESAAITLGSIQSLQDSGDTWQAAVDWTDAHPDAPLA